MHNKLLQKTIVTSFLIISILACYATLSYSGSNGACKKGYERVGNHICKKIKIPHHAEIANGSNSNSNGNSNANSNSNSNGMNWRCIKGYILSDDEERCDKIYLPYNAHLSDDTGVGWECDKGYRPSGKECLEINIKLPELPENAHYTNDQNWECDYGYKRLSYKCVPN